VKHATLPTGIVALALAVAVSAYVFWPTARGAAPGADAFTILDDQAELRSDGIEFNVTLSEPAEVTVTVTLPNDLKGWAWFGLPATATPRDAAYKADRKRSTRFRAPGSFTQTVMSPAVYVIQVEPIPVAMGNESMPMPVHVTVKAVPLGQRKSTSGPGE